MRETVFIVAAEIQSKFCEILDFCARVRREQLQGADCASALCSDQHWPPTTSRQLRGAEGGALHRSTAILFYIFTSKTQTFKGAPTP